MIRTEDYLEPLKYYESALKDLHHENVEAYLEELVRETGVDIDENKVTCTKLYKKRAELKKVNKKLGWMRVALIFCWIFIIGGIIGGATCIATQTDPAIQFGAGIGGIVLGIGLFILWLLVLRKKKKELENLKETLENEARALENEAWAQMSPLNSRFDELMSAHLFSKTAPLIEMDDVLDPNVEDRIVHQFGAPLDVSTARSTLVAQSGKINTNPFLLRQVLTMEMRPEVYTGTLVISYPRVVSDGNGGHRTVMETQTLTASITKPKPHYAVETSLTYYTDVGGNLSFTRKPAGLAGKSDKEMERIANKKDKEEAKKAERAVKAGKTYTKFANSKFEAYINAEGRDNELEYRFLFTPLAQQNYCYNFSKQDDIYYTKNKNQNIIQSTHDVDKDYSGSPLNYYSFDFEVIQKKFIDYNMSYFEGIYLDFVPLISIPAFHENRSEPYRPAVKKVGISMYDAEVLVNRYDPSHFKPDGCDTDVILKVGYERDTMTVYSYGFHADPRIEYVPTMGGDGNMHPVPVHYYEYLPVECNKLVKYFNKSVRTLDKDSESVINYKVFNAELLD